MNEMNKAFVVLLLLALFGTIALIGGLRFISQQSLIEKELSTVFFEEIGFGLEYKIRTLQAGQDENYKIISGTLDFTVGDNLAIYITEQKDYHLDFIEVDGIPQEAPYETRVTLTSSNHSIKGIVSPTNYHCTTATIKENKITIIEIQDIRRYRGFSHGLTKIQLNLEELIVLCKQQNVDTLFYYRGRMFGEGLLRHFDNWFFIEGEILYYYKNQYYFGW